MDRVEALKFVRSYNLQDATDIVQDDLRAALLQLAVWSVSDICDNLHRALDTAQSVRDFGEGAR